MNDVLAFIAYWLLTSATVAGWLAIAGMLITHKRSRDALSEQARSQRFYAQLRRIWARNT